jgi:NADH-quinone oxidoreductase subunit N
MEAELSQAYAQLWADLPAIFSLGLMAVAGLVMITWDVFDNNSPVIPWLGAAAMGTGIVWEALALVGDPGAAGTAMLGLVRTGGFASFINIVILASGMLSIILSVPYLRRIEHDYGEVYCLIMFCTAGMIFLGTANHLVSIFVGLETMSICLYILTGLVREDEGAVESALKYFLLGAFSTGFFLYGMALLYGATGTMALPEMAAGLAQPAAPGMIGSELLFWAGVALLLIGFMFKVSAAPFHMWTPDVYQGAPTTLTGYMSTASKASAFGSLILILVYALPPEHWPAVLAFVAIVTMVIGNVLAISQANVKRMLAYSSVAHGGYVLVGLTAGTTAGYAGALYYLLVYALMNIGAFGVMAFLEWDGKEGREQTLQSLAGIGTRKPLLGVTMGFFMFSLIGFPTLGGFIGKYAVFAPAVQAGYTWLVIIAVLMSAVSAFYYLRVLYVFWFMDESEAEDGARKASFPVPFAPAAVLVVCALLLVVLGVLPFLLGTTNAFFPDAGAAMQAAGGAGP